MTIVKSESILPIEFIDIIHKLIPQEKEDFLSSLKNPPLVSIRINKDKYKEKVDKSYHSVPWCENGYYLSERPSFIFDPLIHAGAYYVQEASSMFIEQVVKQHVLDTSIVLDLCAAPGGKSTLIRSVLPEKSVLICNEIVRSRANILAENMIKWGDIDIAVTNNSPKDFKKMKNTFDVIMADVPCSGEGMFRKDEKAIAEWSLENVEICVERQRDIIKDIWNSLKPNGILIYSTCTYNIEENENNIEWILENFEAESIPVITEKSWGIAESLHQNKEIYAYRFMPHRTKGEGLFVSVIRKKGDQTENIRQKKDKDREKGKKAQTNKEAKKVIGQINEWLSEDFKNQATIVVKEDQVIAYKEYSKHILENISINLNTLVCGLEIATIKGKDIIPTHQLAMAKEVLNSEKQPFYTQELSYEDAIRYLRKESIEPISEKKGYNLVSYKGHILGFIKNIGNRANNMYPNEWRIRANLQ